MTAKELKVIRNCIKNTLDVIEDIAWENYPYGRASDEDVHKMYYDLLKMSLLLTKKIETT